MKKLLSILVLLLYMSATVGATIQLHFCAGELKSWSIAANEGENDCCCEADHSVKIVAEADQSCKVIKQNDCCKEYQVYISNSDHYQVYTQVWNTYLLLPNELNIIYSTQVTANYLASSNIPVYAANAPPGLWQDFPLFLLFHQAKIDC
jgi:hypothetical protein